MPVNSCDPCGCDDPGVWGIDRISYQQSVLRILCEIAAGGGGGGGGSDAGFQILFAPDDQRAIIVVRDPGTGATSYFEIDGTTPYVGPDPVRDENTLLFSENLFYTHSLADFNNDGEMAQLNAAGTQVVFSNVETAVQRTVVLSTPTTTPISVAISRRSNTKNDVRAAPSSSARAYWSFNYRNRNRSSGRRVDSI